MDIKSEVGGGVFTEISDLEGRGGDGAVREGRGRERGSVEVSVWSVTKVLVHAGVEERFVGSLHGSCC